MINTWLYFFFFFVHYYKLKSGCYFIFVWVDTCTVLTTDIIKAICILSCNAYCNSIACLETAGKSFYAYSYEVNRLTSNNKSSCDTCIKLMVLCFVFYVKTLYDFVLRFYIAHGYDWYSIDTRHNVKNNNNKIKLNKSR